ncbi:MAG: DUF86 domain-containing protein [Anaerolineae bacterium]|nr:DUF86 domain-containing protein [Anaerolineae bacterium]
MKVEAMMERLRALDEYIRLLEPYRTQDIRTLVNDRMVYGGVLHYLQLCAQIVMDVSAHIHAALDLERASDYREVILTLGKHHILPPEFAERLSSITGFRNVLVYEYLTVDPLRVQDALQKGIADLQAFMVYITDFLRREGYLTQ